MPVNVNEIEPDEKIVEIEMERLREFRNHPFKVKADGQMLQLIESISKYGVMNPLIVRPLPEGVYEIISGHRRKYAAQHLGFRKMPVIIRVLRDDDAVISMVDSNLFRETISPSEKAFAYKMKYEAIKRKSGRKNGGQIDYHLLGKRTIDIKQVFITGLSASEKEKLSFRESDFVKAVSSFLSSKRIDAKTVEFLRKMDISADGAQEYLASLPGHEDFYLVVLMYPEYPGESTS